MTNVFPNIWLGNSRDMHEADLRKHKVDAILNTAHDLECNRGWPDGVLYVKCGLVDGPGNTMAAYHAAVLMLCSIVTGGRKVLVSDHDAGSRACAVIIMAMHAMRRMGWEHWAKIIAEKTGREVAVHLEHRKAFNRINWRLMSSVFEG